MFCSCSPNNSLAVVVSRLKSSQLIILSVHTKQTRKLTMKDRRSAAAVGLGGLGGWLGKNTRIHKKTKTAIPQCMYIRWLIWFLRKQQVNSLFATLFSCIHTHFSILLLSLIFVICLSQYFFKHIFCNTANDVLYRNV